jgi:hypothetical protein
MYVNVNVIRDNDCYDHQEEDDGHDGHDDDDDRDDY